MRILGLDLGAKRIGLAVSDSECAIAFPAGTLDRRGLARDLSALVKLVSEREVERIVVGLPLHLDGRAGIGARAARDFASALSEATGLPVDTLDERLTTVEAERILRESGAGRKARREAVDSIAATIILRTYLEQRSADGGGQAG
jgi:putative Holliday junction resolvase